MSNFAKFKEICICFVPENNILCEVTLRLQISVHQNFTKETGAKNRYFFQKPVNISAFGST